MTHDFQSSVLRAASERLTAVPIAHGTLGRKLGLARSLFEIVAERYETGQESLDEVGRALCLGYFALRHDYDYDETGVFAHVMATVAGDFVSEMGMSFDDYWRIHQAVDELADRDTMLPLLTLDAFDYFDDRYRDPSTWSNPVAS
jgi:hypothetical protein